MQQQVKSTGAAMTVVPGLVVNFRLKLWYRSRLRVHVIGGFQSSGSVHLSLRRLWSEEVDILRQPWRFFWFCQRFWRLDLVFTGKEVLWVRFKRQMTLPLSIVLLWLCCGPDWGFYLHTDTPLFFPQLWLPPVDNRRILFSCFHLCWCLKFKAYMVLLSLLWFCKYR